MANYKYVNYYVYDIFKYLRIKCYFYLKLAFSYVHLKMYKRQPHGKSEKIFYFL